MPSFRDTTTARLNDLLERTLDVFKDEAITVGQLATRALPEARGICKVDYDNIVCARLKALARKILHKTKPRWQRAPMLIPGLELPYRIAVPPAGSTDEESPDTRWIPLHKCTIAQARRNLQMRDSQITGAQAERDKIKLVIDSAEAETKDPNAVIGEVLDIVTPAASAA